MLVSLLKSKRNDVEARMVHLIPELCFLTGKVYVLCSGRFLIGRRLLTLSSGQDLLQLAEHLSINSAHGGGTLKDFT